MADSNEGKVVKGYRLNTSIGSGGFGTVYHAYQEVLNREVAVKVIKDKYVNDPQFVRQFESEAKIIARLEHFNIVTLYDYWRDPSGAYLVMRWLRGGSLRQHLKQSKLTVTQIVRVLNQIAAALAFAHQNNVIHRDIKPENILLDPQGNAFLTDFGIAVDLRSTEDINVENISFGSPDYVAPEQIRDKIITPRSDIYSLGIMLYELLAHKRPFVSDEPKEIMKMQLYNPVPSLKLERRDLPHEIDTVIWQATAKNPAHRYDSVLELAIAFQSIASKMDDIPADYRISTQTQSEFSMPSVTNMPTENLATGNLFTEPLDDMSTGVLPEFQESGVPEFIDQIDTIADALPMVEEDTTTEDSPLDTPVDRALADETPFVPEDMPESAPMGAGDSFATAKLDMPFSAGTMVLEGQKLPNPYKGLRAFQEADANTFFGRENTVRGLIRNFDEDGARFLALIGPSGSGKSSVVRAGLIPAFKRGVLDGSLDWFYSTMVPSDDPFRELSEALLRVAINAPQNWGETLRTKIQGLHDLLYQILPDDGSELFLFIDQFEEVFTVGDDEEARNLFLDSLWYAVNHAESRLRLVITLRADFYDRPLHYAQFGQMLKDNTEVVLPLNRDELEATILGPAEQIGLKVESGLTGAILNDVQNQPGALPLLQYTLTELYEEHEGNQLKYTDYLALGGISGALAKRAQEIYANQFNKAEQALARQLFLRIISIDENGTATRRRVLWTELMSGMSEEQRNALENVINQFGQYRLLTTDRDPVTRTPTIEIAHEALIEAWGQLRQWIDQNRAVLQTRQELRIEVDRWLSSDRNESYLATGLRLAEFKDLQNDDLLALRPEDIEYIDASVYQDEAELRQSRRISIALGTFSLVTLLLAVLAGFSFYNATQSRNDAEVAAQIARSRELAANAIANQADNDLSLLLAVEAMNTERTYEATNSILLALQENPLLTTYLHGHDARVRDVIFNGDGTRAISVSGDETLIIWNLEDYSPVGTALMGHTLGINAVELSPDEQIIASGGEGRNVIIWDFATGEQLALLEGHTDTIWGLAFNHDGSQLATSSASGEIIIWDMTSYDIAQTLESDHDGVVFSLDYNADGTRLVSGGDDNLVRLWDANSGELIAEMAGHQNWVRVVQFDPFEPAILSSGRDGFIFFWDAETGQQLADPLNTRHVEGVHDFSFAANGQFLATAGADGRIFIWSLLERSSPIATIQTHRNRVWSVDFSPVDFRLISSDENGQIVVSELSAVTRPSDAIFRTDQSINQMLYTQNGETFILGGEATGAPSSTIQVWNNETTELQYQINFSEELTAENVAQLRLLDMELSPDDNYVAVTTASGAVAVWELASGELLWQQSEHVDLAQDIVYTPDGTRLISADESGLVLVWDAMTGTLIETSLYGPQSGGLTSMAISPNGMYLAIAGRENMLVWNIQDETLLLENLEAYNDTAEELLFNTASDILFIGNRNGTITQLAIPSGNTVATFTGHRDWVISMALSPDGDLLLSGERTTGAVIIWDMTTGRAIGERIVGPAGWITDITFIEDNEVIISNRDEQLLSVIDLDLDSWIAQACDIANRTLTISEWEQFFPDEPYTPACGE